MSALCRLMLVVCKKQKKDWCNFFFFLNASLRSAWDRECTQHDHIMKLFSQDRQISSCRQLFSSCSKSDPIKKRGKSIQLQIRAGPLESDRNSAAQRRCQAWFALNIRFLCTTDECPKILGNEVRGINIKIWGDDVWEGGEHGAIIWISK